MHLYFRNSPHCAWALCAWVRMLGCMLAIALPISAVAQGGNVPDDQEYEALMELFNRTNGPDWNDNTNWGNGSDATDFAKWYGVTVVNDDVVGIDLRDNQLVGELPEQLDKLTALEFLMLPENQLKGSLPPVNWSNLVTLDLSLNQLEGEVPSTLANATNLMFLNLGGGNTFSGPILDLLRSCNALQELRLGNNQFSGSLPDYPPGQWPALTVFDLNSNKYSGVLPPNLSYLSAVHDLNLSSNQFTGPVPTQWGTWQSLRVVYLNDNRLTGPLPAELTDLPNLRLFWASNNQFTGVPNFRAAPLRNVLYVDVRNNGICFGPLEANVTNASQQGPVFFGYSGQNMPAGEDTEVQSLDEPIVLSCSFSGAHNLYQWYKRINISIPNSQAGLPANGNWQLITGATAATLRINRPVAADAGSYVCAVTNTWATNLILYTRITTLQLRAATIPAAQCVSTPDSDKNWLVERTFDGLGEAAENIMAENKQFSDGLGRPTQAQVRNLTNRHVLASQTLYDTNGKAVLNTLAAPINNECFGYKESFITANAVPYGPQHFGTPGTGSPFAVDAASTPGTLGYYYSVNNQLEPATPISSYPFRLAEPFTDPLGGIKRAARPGDELRMGQGHESSTRTFPILNDLVHYANARSQFITTPTGANYIRQGHKAVSVDGEGKESINFISQDGYALATCLSGSQYPATQLMGFVDADVTNWEGYPAYQDIHVTSGTQQLTFTVGGVVKITNLVSGQEMSVTVTASHTTGTPAPALAPGFYRLTALTGRQWFTYDAHYGDFSYTYYDDAGRPIAAVSPKGINTTNSNPLTFVTRTTYNSAGQTLSTASADEGLTEFVYAQDGRIRFSQDARQRLAGTFSYVNYDKLNRVIESGEFAQGGGSPLVFENQFTLTPQANSVLQPVLLESRDRNQAALSTWRRSQVSSAWYDIPFTDAELNGRQQEFLRGAVSKTQNDQVTTWYSYDEAGRVSWMVQKLTGLGVKTVDYKYDVTGKVTEVAYQNNQPDAFHHYYEYDADQRLGKVYTSPDGTVRALQVKYLYYLHGPLKRMELANRLQGVDYLYTLDGAIKSINHVNPRLDAGQDSPIASGVPKDLFGLTLDYYSGDYRSRTMPTAITPDLGLRNGTARPTRYDGMARDAAWRTAVSPTWHQMAYAYNEKGELAQSDYGTMGLTGASYQFTLSPTAAYEEGNLQYDSNGNITQLRRRDKQGSPTDNFAYDYPSATNRLTGIHAPGPVSGTNPLLLEYEYDASGQMTHQRDGQQHRYLRYNVSGKVTDVFRAANSQQRLATYAYDDRGFRCRKTTYDATGVENQSTYYVRDLQGNVLATYEGIGSTGMPFQRSEVPLYGASRIGTLTHFDNGQADARYELNDQRGDARVVFHRPTTTLTTASFELTSQAQQEDGQWTGIGAVRTYVGTAPGTGAHQGVTAPSTHVARIPVPANGSRSVGVTRSVSVQKGDTLTFSAWTFLRANTGGVIYTPQRASRLRVVPQLGAVSETPPLGTEAAKQPSGQRTWLSRLSAGVVLTGLGGKGNTQQLQQPGRNTFPSSVWVRYRVVPEDGSAITEHYEYLTYARSEQWQLLRTGVRISEPSTVEVAIGSDDASWKVDFDDLRLEHSDGMIVQEQHQYAYGSPLIGLNYAIGSKTYRHSYQGQFAEKDVETGWDSFEARLYDARIGRWLSPDAVKRTASSYIGMGNNPVIFGDPDGKDIILLNDTHGAHTTLAGRDYYPGHCALLIGSDETGWKYISKAGGNDDKKVAHVKRDKFATLSEFISSKDAEYTRYDRATRFSTTHEQDVEAYVFAEKEFPTRYQFLFNNCAQGPNNVLNHVGGFGVSPSRLVWSTVTGMVPNAMFEAIAQSRNALTITGQNMLTTQLISTMGRMLRVPKIRNPKFR